VGGIRIGGRKGVNMKSEEAFTVLLGNLTSQQLDVNVLQVGACDAINTSLSNDPVARSTAASKQKVYMLEPNPSMFEKLKTQVAWDNKAYGSKNSAWNYAVCPEKTGTVPFYRVSPKFGEAYPKAPHWMRNQLSSMNRSLVVKNLEYGIKHKIRTRKPTKDGLLKVCGMNDCVEEIPVTCFSPLDLFKNITLKPSDLDVLVIDAEGLDAKLVKHFLKVSKPKIVYFEVKHSATAELEALFTQSRKLGYSTNCKNIERCKKEGQDALMWSFSPNTNSLAIKR